MKTQKDRIVAPDTGASASIGENGHESDPTIERAPDTVMRSSPTVENLDGFEPVAAGQTPQSKHAVNESKQPTVPQHPYFLDNPAKTTPQSSTVSYTDWTEWRIPDLRRSRGEWFTFERVSALPQQVLSIADLSAPQQELVNRLSARSRAGREQARNYAYAVERRRFLERVGDRLDQWSSADIDEWVESRIADVQSAEVGAWYVRTPDAVVVIELSSGHHRKIDTPEVEDALNRVLSHPLVALDEIEEIQFWHTHPARRCIAPLSDGDGGAFRNIKTALEEAGISAPLSMFAINELEDEHFVFRHHV